MHSAPDQVNNTSLAKYDFSLSEVFREGWERIKGFKAVFWGAFAIYLLISLALVIFTAIISFVANRFMDENGYHALMQLVNVADTLIKYPAAIGLLMMGVKRAADQPIQAFDVLHYYNKFLTLSGVLVVRVLIVTLFAVIAGICMGVASSADMSIILQGLIFLGGCVAIAAGVYLFWSYTFAGQLCAAKGLGIRASLKASFAAVNQHWFKLFFLGILVMLITLLAFLPLAIGLIWAAPWNICVWGILYRKIFGADQLKQ